MTFLWFPILVVIAYIADIGVFDRIKKPQKTEGFADIELAATDAGDNVSAKDARLLQYLQKSEDEGPTRAARRAYAVGPKAISAKDLSVGFLAKKYCFHEEER